MAEGLLLIVFLVLGLLIAVFISLADTAKNPPEMHVSRMVCTEECKYTECKFNELNKDTYAVRVDLKWTPACPYFYREDIDDPEG